MKIWLYALTWNNEDILPFFLNHYAYCRRVTIIDDGSTDSTAEIVNDFAKHNMPMEYVWQSYTHLSGNKFREDIRAEVKNQCWKEAKGKADWVIIVDPDEFLWHPDGLLLFFLEKMYKKGHSILLPTGYEMISQVLPVSNFWMTDVVKHGVRNDLYSKPCVFDPNLINEINFAPGCHTAMPMGKISYNECLISNISPVKPYPPTIVQRFVDYSGKLTKERELKLLHYRFLGPDRVGRLWDSYKPRMSEVNLKNRWDRHCYLPKEEQLRIFKLLQEQAVQIVN